MADEVLVVPSSVEDPQVLKRFLSDLVVTMNTSPMLQKNPAELANTVAALADSASTNPSFMKTLTELRRLQGDIKAYVEENLVTNILQNSEDVALVAEQFGTFYDQALAAAWYGLTVKAGSVISGFTIGAIDTDTTTPGTEGSFFAINADIFSVARAIEDISDPAELAYVQAHGLPYGTMYNASTEEIIPAFTINWTGTEYLIDFNGTVSFNNITDTEDLLSDLSGALEDIADLEETNDGVVVSFYQTTAPTSGMSYGDWWIDTNSDPLLAYRYEDPDGKNVGTLAWRDESDSIIGKSYISAINAQATADGKISAWYSTSFNKPDAKTGDLLFKLDAYNKPYRALQDAPVDAGDWTSIQDTTVPENIYKPGTTTIKGGILAADTIWVGGGIYSASPEFAWTSGNPPVGFGLNGEGIEDPDNAGTYYNIVGGSIYGATVKGSLFDLGTGENVVLTTSGYETKSFFYDDTIAYGYELTTGQNPSIFKAFFDSTIYAYNYPNTDGDGKRFRTESYSIVEFMSAPVTHHSVDPRYVKLFSATIFADFSSGPNVSLSFKFWTRSSPTSPLVEVSSSSAITKSFASWDGESVTFSMNGMYMICDVITTGTTAMSVNAYVKEVETIDFASTIGSWALGTQMAIYTSLAGSAYQEAVTDLHGVKVHNI
jgi:hypothetical protein